MALGIGIWKGNAQGNGAQVWNFPEHARREPQNNKIPPAFVADRRLYDELPGREAEPPKPAFRGGATKRVESLRSVFIL